MVLVSALAVVAAGCKSPTEDALHGSGSAARVVANASLAGSPTFDRMKARGKAIIGVKEDLPGLGYRDPTTNAYAGFDIGIADLVAGQLGFGPDQIEYRPIPTASREQALINGDVDFYVGTYSINDKRKRQVSFAGPYYIAGQDLLVRKADDSITGPDSLAGKRVCSATGSTPIQNIKKNHPQANVVEFDSYAQCVDQLIHGQVDAVTTDDAILKGYAAQLSDKLKVVGKPFSTEKYGIGLPKDDNALRDRINTIIEDAEQNGTWQAIYDSTLGRSGSPATSPPVDRY